MSEEKRLNREDILRIVSELDFFGGEDSTRDVDVICTRALADRLEARDVPFRRDGLDNTRIFAFNSLVEVLEDWDTQEIVEEAGLRTASLLSIRAQKAALGREKDLADMALIDAFLERKEAGK